MNDPRESVGSEHDFRLAILLLLERIAVALETPKLAEEIRKLLANATTEINFPEHTPEGDPDYLAALAAEVERSINGGSTPSVTREVEVQEPTETYEVHDKIEINLLEQPREHLDSIKERVVGDDPIIQAAEESNNPVAIAAVEIVYSHLSIDLWGSQTAEKHIAQLMAIHKDATI